MHTNPKENRTQPDFILIEEFRRKGYQYREVREEGVTTIFLTHDKKTAGQKEQFPETTQGSLRKFLGYN